MENKRYYILDSLKALAIIFVITTHFSISRADRLMLGFPFWIVMAVPIFMFVSGFVNAASMSKKGISTFSDCYSKRAMVGKLVRFLVPFLLIAAAEIFLSDKIVLKSLDDGIRFFFQGAKGPGGYYVMLMVQFMFMCPAIYFVMKKNPKKGIIIAFIFTLLYEIFCSVNNVSYTFYTQLILRYVFIIAFGTFLCLNTEKVSIWWYIASFILGTAYIIAHDYFGYASPVIRMWQTTSLYGVLYLVPVLALIMRFLSQVRIPPLEWIGKRTYSIFLVQMVYYFCFDKQMAQLIPNTFLHYIVNLAICIGGGALYYLLVEKLLTGFIVKQTDRLFEGKKAA